MKPSFFLDFLMEAATTISRRKSLAQFILKKELIQILVLSQFQLNFFSYEKPLYVNSFYLCMIRTTYRIFFATIFFFDFYFILYKIKRQKHLFFLKPYNVLQINKKDIAFMSNILFIHILKNISNAWHHSLSVPDLFVAFIHIHIHFTQLSGNDGCTN